MSDTATQLPLAQLEAQPSSSAAAAPANTSSTAASPPTAPDAGDDLHQLRELLLGPQKGDIELVKEHVVNPALRARDIGAVLPQALMFSSSGGDQLAKALAPVVESTLRESVRRNPAVVVDAIFPVMGPAIRKAIADALAKLIQAISQGLENTFTLRGLKWRFEALRTGRSFAEVVLYHTLVYRVEQLFLIHRHTGLLLQHLQLQNVVVQDSNMVSGMLTAIQDFVRDSFRVEQGEQLQTMQVGELNVWVESGPQAILAAVIRGHAPVELREALQGALERIHGEQANDLSGFSGDAQPFILARTHLEPCLREQFGTESKQRHSNWKLYVAAAAAAGALIVWAGFKYVENRRWDAYVETIRSQDGIVVIEAFKRSGTFHIRGLRDPLAIDPAQFLAAAKVDPSSVKAQWEPYQALSTPLVYRRAVKILAPPSTVTLKLASGVLSAEGAASRSWIENARARAALIPGVTEFNVSRVEDETRSLFAARTRQIENTVFQFDDDSQLVPGQEPKLKALVAQLNELRSAALQTGAHLTLSVIGHTDKTGTEQHNARLSQERAEAVQNLLLRHGLGPMAVTLVGMGSREPVRPQMSEQEERQNRRVTLRVTIERPISAVR